MSLVPTWPFAVGTLVIGLLAGACVDHLWMNHKVAAAEKRYDDLKDSQAEALAQANAANLKKQDELQAQVDESEMKRGMDNAQSAKDLESARSDVRTERERLSIRGACSAKSSAPTSATSGSGTEERTYLLPETADAIVSIAGAAAEDVRSYNALLDRYNAVCK